MVSAAELRAQQLALRKPEAKIPLQIQQIALQRGVSPQQIILERERTRAIAEITRQLKTQASKVDDIFKNINSLSQFQELINQVPPELRQFLKTTEVSIRRDLDNRIKQINDKITLRQTQIANLRIAKEEANKEGNKPKAERLDAERRGLEKETDFLRGVLPRFQEGELIPITKVFSVARDIGLSEEEKRRVIERELQNLSSRLEGGREELKTIIRTQQITQPQAIQLGLIPAQIPIEPTPIIKELPPPTELLPGEVTQIPGQVQKPIVDLENIPKDFRDVFPKSTLQDILGSISGSGVVDFSKSTGVGGFAGIDVGGLGLLGIGVQPFGVTPTAKPIFEELSKGIGFVREKVKAPFKEREKEFVEFGEIIPTKPEQLEIPKKETLEFIPKQLSIEEIKGLTFGGGLGRVEEIRVKEAEVELNNLANLEADKQFPTFKKRAEDKSVQLQNQVNAEKISVEDANIELKEFIDNLNKEYQGSIKKVVDKRAGELEVDINKEITEAFKRNTIKRELLLLSVTIPISFVLGFAGTISPIIAGGLTAFGLTQVAKVTPIVVTAIKTKDIQTLGGIGIQVAGFAVGGLIGAKIGGKFIQSIKIRIAIKRANVQSKTIARNLEVLRKLKLTPKLKSEIKTLIDKGFEVRLVETKLVASNVVDGKILPNVRGRFIEVVNRQGKIVDVISIGSVISVVRGKIYSQEIISESVGKIEGTKIKFITRSIIGKLKGDKFKPISEVRTFQETTLVGRRVTPFKELTLAESITKLISEGKIKGKKIDISKISKVTFKDFGLKDLGKINLKSLEAKLSIGAKGRVISKTGVVGVRKITTGDITIQKLVSTTKGKGFQISADLGTLLTSLKQFESKAFGLTISIPKIKITTPKPRDTLKEVFEAGRDVGKFKFDFKFPKFDFKKFFKTKDGQIFQQSQTQINQNLDLLTQTTAPAVVTKAAAKVKPTTPFVFVTGKIAPFEDLGKVSDLGVLSGRLDTGLLTGLETGLLTGLETEQQRKKRLREGFLSPNITKSVQDLGQIPKTSIITKQIQPQTQLNLQLEKLQTDLAGFGITQPTITITTPKIDIPFVFKFPKKPDKLKLKLEGLDRGFNVFVKSKGKKIKVTKNPVIESSAKDIGSFLVDNTLSAQFSLKESRKPPQKPKIQVPRNYWELNKNKFRTFRIRKGQQIPLKNTFIELKPQRLDTFGEIRKITAERLLAQRRGKKTNINKVSKNLKKIFGF